LAERHQGAMKTALPQMIAVTGASGLLGSALHSYLSVDTGVLPLGHSVALPGVQSIDLLKPVAEGFLGNAEWDAIVHCAAYRSPDFCDTHRDQAHRLNAVVPGEVAALARERGARMLHISTDYVFAGDDPPYSETDRPNPINYYGQTKLDAEKRVMDAYPEAVVLRVPALYGEPPPPLISPLVEDAIETVIGEVPRPQDTSIVRYPTHLRDVAHVVRYLLESDFNGIVQASATERTTRYEWTCCVARLLGRDPACVQPLDFDPDRKAPRPTDVHLDCRKLASLGAPMPRGYSYWLPGILKNRGLL
jgi:dTDP-4-dehydrorhamnose reductase